MNVGWQEPKLGPRRIRRAPPGGSQTAYSRRQHDRRDQWTSDRAFENQDDHSLTSKKLIWPLTHFRYPFKGNVSEQDHSSTGHVPMCPAPGACWRSQVSRHFLFFKPWASQPQPCLTSIADKFALPCSNLNSIGTSSDHISWQLQGHRASSPRAVMPLNVNGNAPSLDTFPRSQPSCQLGPKHSSSPANSSSQESALGAESMNSFQT